MKSFAALTPFNRTALAAASMALAVGALSLPAVAAIVPQGVTLAV